MTDYKCLLYEVKDAVATLTLNRPERLNALGDTLRDDLYAAVLRASGDADVRVLIVTGEIIDAPEALRLGIVNAVYQPEELLPATYELARKIAAGPPVAIRLAKRALYHSEESDLRGALEFETFAQNVCSETEDAREGIKAFVEKRAPQFKGR